MRNPLVAPKAGDVIYLDACTINVDDVPTRPSKWVYYTCTLKKPFLQQRGNMPLRSWIAAWDCVDARCLECVEKG